MTSEQAKTLGYRSVTTPYGPEEQELLAAAIRQFQGASIAIVETDRGTEIWRLESELRRLDDETLSASEARRPEHYGRR